MDELNEKTNEIQPAQEDAVEEAPVADNADVNTEVTVEPTVEATAEATAQNPEPSENGNSVDEIPSPPETPSADDAVPLEEQHEFEETSDDKEYENKFMWSFSEQARKDREEAKKVGKKGAFIYACVMTGLFFVCFAVLAVLLFTGFGSGSRNKTVVVGESNYAIADIVDNVKDSVVTITVTTEKGRGFGSGFVYTDDGYIITNYHVVDGATSIHVVCTDGRELLAEYIDGDELSDVAVIKVKNLGLPKLVVGNSDNLRVGEYVIAIGTPVDTEYAGSVTMGIVSGLKRTVRVYETSGLLEKSMEMIQTDTSLNPGNSGGPLFNMAGEVVGINTMKHVSSSSGDVSYENLGFAIQINDAVEIANDIIEDGKYSGNKGSATQGVQLGITCSNVYKGQKIEVAEGVFITPETDGVIVNGISEGYPCDGKLELYDVIFSLDGVKTPSVERMRGELFKHKVGDTIFLEVWRNGELIKIEITL